jgi:hypothetical protein
MEDSMLANNPCSDVPIVPPQISAIFGEPPLIRGEDDGLYHTLMEQFIKLVEPKNVIEWVWVKDLTDHTWEIGRLRRYKVHFIELQRDLVVHNRGMFAALSVKDAEDEEGEDEEGEYVPQPVPLSEKDSAEMFMDKINDYKNVDKLVASAELRLSRTLREIDRRRADLARRLRKASDEAVDGEGGEQPKAAA